MVLGKFINDTLPACPEPLLEQSKYRNAGGYISGRYCGVGANEDGTVCCFPCPVQEWVYPEDWKSQLRVPNYLSIFSVILCVFLLVSFAVLPPAATHRHYLSVGLLFPVLLISLSFVIPAGTNPPLCYDAITPNDMRTNLSCAWTGALVTVGGLGSVMWVFLRSLWLHIRICWDRDPGKWFKIGSIAAGTILPLALLAALTAATGFSYRMGQTCLPNHEHAIVSFWVWLVSFAIAGFLLQAGTTAYCMIVFVRSLRREQERSQSSGTATRIRTWKNVKKLFLLQWRNILVSIFVLIGSISFFIVFWTQDAKLGRIFNDPRNLTPVKIWLTCLTLSRGDKDACRKYVKNFTVPRESVLASLILASLVGIEIFILLARISMFRAWRQFFRRPFNRFSRPQSPPLTSLENPPPHLSTLPFTKDPVSESMVPVQETSSLSSSSTHEKRDDRIRTIPMRPVVDRVTSDTHLLTPALSTYSSGFPSQENTPLPSPSIHPPHVQEGSSFMPRRDAPVPPARSFSHTVRSRSALSNISAPVPGSFQHVSSASPFSGMSPLSMNPPGDTPRDTHPQRGSW